MSENQKAAMAQEILRLPEAQVLNTPVNDLCQYLTEKYSIDVPILDDENIHVDQHDTRVDVSHDPMRLIFDRSQPFYVSGTTIEVIVPFTGEGDAFGIRPTTFNLNQPRAKIRGNELVLAFTGPDLNGERLRGDIQRQIADIKTNLERLRNDAASLRQQLSGEAGRQVEQRRQKFLADHSLVTSLGFPLKRRSDTPQTYRAPEVKRRVQLRPPSVTATFKPEPTLDMAEYDHILSVMTNMALVMERSPAAFEKIGEEDLRTHFLVQLNGHYEGDATGETFNYGGKTDILIRSDGRNIFIGECKYWGGPKKLLETVDQIRGYTSWRDSKAAILLFNRQKNFSAVVESIPATMIGHSSVKREIARPSETSFRYILGQRDDPNREIMLTVMAFDVPQPTSANLPVSL